MGKLDGKIALVTGGTTGIGHATAALFAAEGAKVIVTGVNPDTIAAAKASLGEGVEVIQSDSSKVADVTALFADIKARHGHLDVLFVNAGIAFFAPNEVVDEAFYDRLFALNVKGAYFAIQQGAAIMSDGGSIVLTGSVSGIKGQPGGSVYGATKAAIRSFARSFAAELGPRGIRVNTLSPGPIETPIFGKAGLPPEALEGFMKHILGGMPLARIGQAPEIARVALFLASEDSSYVTGIDLLADGGMGSV